MVAAPKIAGPRPCACTDAALAAAELVGIRVEYVPCENFSFTTPDGQTFDTTATALRYFARMRPDVGLYGRTFGEGLAVDHWMGKICKGFLLPLTAAAEWSAAGGDCGKIFEDVANRMKCVESHLLRNTFLVCERMTICDVLLAITVGRFEARNKGCFDEFPNVRRWASTVQGHPSIKKYIAGPQQNEKQQNRPAGKEQPKEQPKGQPKEQPKDAKELTGEELEEHIAAEEKSKKKVNPLDGLPPSSFVLDAWKREYSNSKDYKKSMEWFWQNLDKDGWSLWFMKYNKLEGENTVGFTTSNMLGGFLQRLDNAFRKYSFAVIDVVGETGNFDIQGIWLVRGREIPFELTDHPSYEYNTFKRLDAVADKALIEEYWTADEKVEGRPIDSCKVWK